MSHANDGEPAASAPARLFATPGGVTLGPLDAIADGAARNFVIRLRAGYFHGFVVRHGAGVRAMSIAARTWVSRSRGRSMRI